MYKCSINISDCIMKQLKVISICKYTNLSHVISQCLWLNRFVLPFLSLETKPQGSKSFSLEDGVREHHKEVKPEHGSPGKNDCDSDPWQVPG